ncbi:MAG TPA: hypothetical protein VM032_09035, partial [Vicinamibacterales bacterium]|nr:hypothetical protein [Vicinamibacterales bacterium]
MTPEALDVIVLGRGPAARRVRLTDYLDPQLEAGATASEYAWIKRLRHLMVDGQPLRRRFSLRGDSLWWFAELYLHKQQAILGLFRTIAAMERLIDCERPTEININGRHRLLRGVAGQVAAARGILCRNASGFGGSRVRLFRMDWRARGLTLAAMGSRFRPKAKASGDHSQPVAAFVHRAFWRADGADGSAESYIGPVLEALERRPGVAVQYVGVGPRENFRARRWWHALRPRRTSGAAIPIESLTSFSSMRDSRRVWRQRHATRRALWESAEVRQHAIIEGYDCWPVVREELAGIALLQWPWSARAMDEAGAALEALKPAVALTYAEAGGWGRALMLEARRRGIPTAGLQHGFIYGSWLNYLHELDEMLPDPANGGDAGFPRPMKTLVFDEYARRHLEQLGRFPVSSLVVTGSPRLDALVHTAAALSSDVVAAARAAAGAGPAAVLVLLVAKYTQARHVLQPLADAIAAMPGVQLAIKTHPAETPEAYTDVVRGCPNVRVLPAAAPLAPLLRASRAIVTVNSTVALDAAVLGIPALVIGLPNNLSPFVD